MKLQECDILMFKGSDLFSTLIRMFTWSKYSHAGILIRNGMNNTVGEALAKGFEINDYGQGLTHMIENNVVDVYRMPGLTQEQRDKILAYVNDSMGSDYDWFNIFQIAVFTITGEWVGKDNPKKLICTEAVIRAFNKAGIRLVGNKPMYAVKPSDLADDDTLDKKK